MGSTQQAGSSTNGSRGCKIAKGDKAKRRTWSPREETSLIASLKELVANGWKSDNGFRGGYITKLEEALSKEFPGADIKGVPHITSKLANWKRNYYSLNLMLSRSGVGWNANGDYTIDCTDEQWDQICKCDGNASSMRQRSWPMFEDWQVVFGRDRATGDNAEDISDAVNNMTQEDSRGDSGKQFDPNEVSMEDASPVNDVGENSSSRAPKENVVNSKPAKGKKRKSNIDGLQAAVEMFCDISRGTNERLAMVANRVGHEYDVDQAKKDAYALVENMPGLTEEQQFEIFDIFTDQRNRMLTFVGLPEHKRENYVHRLLKLKKWYEFHPNCRLSSFLVDVFV